MKCLSLWPDHCEMFVASMKAANKLAVLALYSKSKGCAKHVHVRAGPPLSEAVIGVEKSHLIFCKLLCLWSVAVVVQSCGFSIVSGVWYMPHATLVLAELIVCSMRRLTCILANWF